MNFYDHDARHHHVVSGGDVGDPVHLLLDGIQMMTYILIMWTLTTPAFMAGEYQTLERCEQAAAMQRVGLRHLVGPHQLHWRCELREQTS